jgi:hypothetical protein
LSAKELIRELLGLNSSPKQHSRFHETGILEIARRFEVRRVELRQIADAWRWRQRADPLWRRRELNSTA